MKVQIRFVSGGIGLLVLAAVVVWEPQAVVPGAVAGSAVSLPQRSAEGKRTPVLLELFTSEGCSSCPPADAQLARLAKTQPVAGAEVIALEEHVDYWNHLGWRDPFSSAEYSARQSGYAESFGNNGVYTPQMIVDGRTEFVGGADGQARQAISRAAQVPKAAVQLQWAQNTAIAGAAIALRIEVESLGQVNGGDTAEVFLAITEDNLHSDVKRGENAGRSLDHIGVVRELIRIGKANSQAAPAFSAQRVVTLLPAWKRENLRAVVFVQGSHSRRVRGAASIPVAAQ